MRLIIIDEVPSADGFNLRRIMKVREADSYTRLGLELAVSHCHRSCSNFRRGSCCDSGELSTFRISLDSKPEPSSVGGEASAEREHAVHLGPAFERGPPI